MKRWMLTPTNEQPDMEARSLAIEGVARTGVQKAKDKRLKEVTDISP